MWCYEAGPTALGIGMQDVNMSLEHAVSHFTCLSTFLSVSELSWSDFNNNKKVCKNYEIKTLNPQFF